MAIMTADRLKAREFPAVTVDLGGGEEVLCRRPDLPTLIFEGILPTALMTKVMKTIAEWADLQPGAVTADMLASDPDLRAFVDKWVCAAMVQPRAVMSEELALGDAVWVQSLRVSTRATVFAQTFYGRTPEGRAATEAAERFPDVGGGPGGGPDVPAVLPAAV